jgi:DNA polymerase III subunit beta
MSTKLHLAPVTATLAVERSPLLKALQRLQAVIPKRCPKPVLTGAWLEAGGGWLRLRGTDGELAVYRQLPATGDLPPTLVPCEELIRRVKAAKQPTCQLGLSDDARQLHVNGGRVDHAIETLEVADFPVVPDAYAGDTLAVDAAEFMTAAQIAATAIAREPSRYAIDGVLLESDDRGTHLVATDGRRLVVTELRACQSEFAGAVVLPSRLLRLADRLTARDTDHLVVAVDRPADAESDALPARVFIAGPDWLISTFACEGSFPVWRDVVPASASRFAVDRAVLLETLQEVAEATTLANPMVRLSFGKHQLQLAAHAPERGSAQATLAAEYLGGGDPEIQTAFNPGYLLNALRTLTCPRVVCDLEQNHYGCDHSVIGRPVILATDHDPATRWIIMPVDAGLEPTPANLGSNYPEHLMAEAST